MRPRVTSHFYFKRFPPASLLLRWMAAKKLFPLRWKKLMAAPESGLDDRYVISSSIDCEMDVLVAVMDVSTRVSPRWTEQTEVNATFLRETAGIKRDFRDERRGKVGLPSSVLSESSDCRLWFVSASHVRYVSVDGRLWFETQSGGETSSWLDQSFAGLKLVIASRGSTTCKLAHRSPKPPLTEKMAASVPMIGPGRFHIKG